MFPWNIAKSAEAMFSRWAVKHALKFLLKKKLGKFIIGDLDLDQLDVQLGAGTIQLSDLALNVAYINQKFGASPVIVKEGSIGSLLIKIPWRVKNCQIEVEELELVLVPCARSDVSDGAEISASTQDCKKPVIPGSEKLEQETINCATAISVDVHEGVKTIAKMVKWLLTSFHVKVQNLIVAYDPCSSKDEIPGSCRALVLRIKDIEYGTCVNEDAKSSSDIPVDSFLGMTRLTNFVKFQGAIIELLQMDDVDRPIKAPSASGVTFSEWCAGSSLSEATTPILTGVGGGGGFSGNLKLSIPWKNGSLDIQKVDIDVHSDPMEFRLQLSTILWIICSWQSLTGLDKDGQGQPNCRAAHSIYYNASSQLHSSSLGSAAIGGDRVRASSGSFSAGLSSQMKQDTPRDALLRGSHIIPDWVPRYSNINHQDIVEAEPDFSASIDQFFECFDGLRTSNSALSNSGIWNWTCSVFTAITAASSLASGSMHIPSKQQHVETNVKVYIAGISFVLPLHDEDEKHAHNIPGNVVDIAHNIHYMGAKFEGLLIVLQICPHETKLEATVKHIEADDYFIDGSEAGLSGMLGCENTVRNRSLWIEQLQAEIQDALPPFRFFQPVRPVSMEEDISGTNKRTIPMDNLVKMKLLKTLSVTRVQLTISSTNGNSSLTSSVSFSLKLPPFIFWVNFNLVKKLLDLKGRVDNYFQMKNENKDSDPEDGKLGSSCHADVKGGRCPSIPCKGSLRGNISLSKSRVIFCFPLVNHGSSGCSSFWDQFICVDTFEPLSKERSPDVCSRDARFLQAFSNKASGSIHVSFGSLEVYLITRNSEGSARNNSYARDKSTYFAEEILSVTTVSTRFPGISLLWQDGPVTGPWVAKRARNLATSQDLMRRKSSVTGKGYEFASVTTAGDQSDINSCTRQEMILSSEVLLHLRLPSVSVRLRSSQYQLLFCLLNQVMDDMLCLGSSSSTNTGSMIRDGVPQTSFLLECDSANVLINLEKVDSVRCSLKTELLGSWHCLKLQIRKVELLCVSNIGGICGGNLFWLGHGEGKLKGTVDVTPDQELLLISCINSTVRRGDGEGTNALSLGSAGTAILYLWDPQDLQSFSTVTIRGCTIIAPSGRLDWMNVICHFFSLPSGNDKARGGSIQKKSSEDSASHGASFVFNLVDIALSYEPFIKKFEFKDRTLEPALHSFANNEEPVDPCVACLLAAASLNISNQTTGGSMDNEYKIRLQDLGLLLCSFSGLENVQGFYDVEYLHKTGYVKVASEALMEAVLRTNCRNGLLWELECYDSHINLDTCHDSASGITRLAAQLQQLFAPDLQESVVHLQSRWNAVQQAHNTHAARNETQNFDDNSATSTSSQDITGSIRYGVVGLMDEVCEDAFPFNGNGANSSDAHEIESRISIDETLFGEPFYVKNSRVSSNDASFTASMPIRGLERTQTSSLQNESFPELLESYYICGSHPLPELSVRNHSLNADLICKSKNEDRRYVGNTIGGWYRDSSLKIVENHIPKVTQQIGEKEFSRKLKLPSVKSTEQHEICSARGRIILKNIDLRWRMYAGSDWPSRMIGQFVARTSGRDTTTCLELTLSGLNLQYDFFPDGNISVSKLYLSVQDFNIYDRSKDAPWKLVLGYYHSKDHPRESSAKALKLELEAVRPDPSTPLEEYRLRLALLPLLLHLDQDQVDFLICFFGEKGSSSDQSPSPHDVHGSRTSSTSSSSSFGGSTISEEALLPFIQKFDIWPIVLRVDYSPRHFDPAAALRGGNYVHFAKLAPWKGVELHLRHVHAVGIYGWSSVCGMIVDEWLEDIKDNQVHKILKGLPPIRSLFTVGSGAAKLVSLPVKNYKKDQKLLKGIQRGATAFLRSISLEAVGLGVHLAAGAHDILVQTEYILSSIPSSGSSPPRSKPKTNIRSNQPKDAQQGIQQAYESLSDGLGKTASALVGTPLKTYQRGGGAGPALASAVFAAPAAAVAPASAAVRAVHCAFLGIRNSLDPEHKKESAEKYFGPSQPRERN